MLTQATKTDIEYIVNVWNEPEWTELKPFVFDKGNEPFGLISTQMHDGILLINSISKDTEPYTFGMNKYLANQIKGHKKVVLASTMKDSTAIHKLMDAYHENGIESYFTKGL